MSIEFLTVNFNDIFYGNFDLGELIDKEVNTSPDHLRKVIVINRLLQEGQSLEEKLNRRDVNWTSQLVFSGNYKKSLEKFVEGEFSVMIISGSLLDGVRFAAPGTVIYTCDSTPELDARNILQLEGRFRGGDSKVIAICPSKSREGEVRNIMETITGSILQ